MKIKTVTLRLSDGLHKALKIKMANEGRKIQDYIVELLMRDMEFKEADKE